MAPYRRFLVLLAVSCSLASGQGRADTDEDQYAIAAGHYAQSRWKLAAEAFEEFLRDHPGNARGEQALFYLAESLVQLEQYKPAQARFSELLQKYPDSRRARRALFRRGEAALLEGENTSAKRDLVEFHRKYADDPLDEYVLPYLADLELRDDRLIESQKLFQAALARFPSGILASECRLGLARALERQRLFVDAASGYKQLAEHPDQPLAETAQFQLGSVQIEAGQFAEAVETFSSFEARFPVSSLKEKAEVARGRALEKLGKHAEAEALLLPLIETASVRIEVRYWLGTAQKSLRHHAQAAQTFLKAVDLEPLHVLAPALRQAAGESLLQDGRFAKAAEQFDRVIGDFPHSEFVDDAWLGKLQVATRQKAYSQVQQLATQFGRLFPDSPFIGDVELTRATALVALGQYSEAVKPLQDYLKGSPEPAKSAQAVAALVTSLTHLKRTDEVKALLGQMAPPEANQTPEVTYQLAEAAYASGNRKLAAQLFTKLTVEGMPPEYVAKGLSGLAWSQFHDSDLAGSASTFERLLRTYPDDPLSAEAALARGRALEKLGQLDPALAMYHLVLDSYPHSSQVAEAMWTAGRLHEQLDQRQQAIQLYRRLIEEHASSTKIDGALYRTGWLLKQTEHPVDARLAWERLRSQCAGSRLRPDATYRLAELALSEKKYAEAKVYLDELTTSLPTGDLLAYSLYLAARMAMAQEHWDEVANPLERLLKEFPESPLGFSASYWLAESTYRQAKYEDAAKQFAELLPRLEGRQEKWLPMVSLRHAQALAQLGQWHDALVAARKIAGEYPQFDEMYEVDYVIGRCLAAEAEFDAARSAYHQVISAPRASKTETAAMAQWMIGESYFHQEDYSAALREYLKVEILYAFPRWQSAALLQAGKCHEALDEWKQAVELYSKLIQQYKSTEFAPEAAGRLSIAAKRAAVPRRS